MNNLTEIIPIIFYLMVFLVNTIYYSQSYDNKREKITSIGSFRYIHWFIRYSSVMILFSSLYYPNKYLFILYQSQYTLYIGMAISAIATILFLSAKVSLGVQYSPCYDSYIPNDLIKDGLYRYVRHPLYISNILLLFGVMLSSGSQLILFNLSILSIYYFISAIIEEREIIKHYPKYKNYKNETGMFIPTKFKMRK